MTRQRNDDEPMMNNEMYEWTRSILLKKSSIPDDSELIMELKDGHFSLQDLKKATWDEFLLPKQQIEKAAQQVERRDDSDKLREFYAKAFHEYLQKEGIDDVLEMLTSADGDETVKTMNLPKRKEIKRLKTNLSKAQKTYRHLQSIINQQLSWTNFSDRLRYDHIRNDINQHPILMKILSNEMEKFKVYVNRIKRIIQEKYVVSSLTCC